jgi:DNA adenine methylase
MVVEALTKHAEKHSDAYYYEVRNETPKGAVARAARLIYLNRTCFNGIYRVNRKGQFNVPRGSKNTVFMESDDFASIASALRKAQLIAGDFSIAIDQAMSGDLVFADPPYTVRHNNNGFLHYNENIFSWSDQIRLADCLAQAMSRGAFVISTNANHESVRELYKERGFTFRTTSRFSAISGTGKDRGQYEELIITSPL